MFRGLARLIGIVLIFSIVGPLAFAVHSAGQSIPLFGVLTALAVLPATLCWWLAKPLHRASIAA
jgi:predicted ABC-type exoprotein transport system permease subunit